MQSLERRSGEDQNGKGILVTGRFSVLEALTRNKQSDLSTPHDCKLNSMS